MSSSRLAIVIAALYMAATLGNQTSAMSVVPPKWFQDNMRFTFKSGANGKTSDGADFSAVTYESSDGIIVTAITETYASGRQAERALQKKLRRATRTLSRGPKIASTGKRVGTRIVARFPPSDQYLPSATILWTDGSELHYVGSSSLKHVQELEKTFRQ